MFTNNEIKQLENITPNPRKVDTHECMKAGIKGIKIAANLMNNNN